MTSPLPPVADSPPNDIDDYMSMTIAEPTKPLEKETYSQRRVRKQREAEARAHPKSKAELAAAADAARDAALSTALPSTSKGFKMMAKLGFQVGNALGASTNTNARTEPLEIAVKEDKGGVGMENEKKRKFREEAAALELSEKKQKAEEEDYRERVGKEREERRVEGQFWGAMKVLERLERPEQKERLPPKRINVLWRGLVRDREVNERERRMKYDLHQSLTRDKNYGNPDEDESDRQVLGTEEEDVEEEDEELNEFLALAGKERLRRLVGYLRAEHRYCFWCKFQHENENLDGCPGMEEDDHD
ncbi:hypothetical protein ACLMJK_006664 [Lecanora helva]